MWCYSPLLCVCVSVRVCVLVEASFSLVSQKLCFSHFWARANMISKSTPSTNSLGFLRVPSLIVLTYPNKLLIDVTSQYWAEREQFWGVDSS